MGIHAQMSIGTLPHLLTGESIMVLCPVAIAVGCRKCPIFKICPVKGLIGDYGKEPAPPAKGAPGTTKAKRGAGKK